MLGGWTTITMTVNYGTFHAWHSITCEFIGTARKVKKRKNSSPFCAIRTISIANIDMNDGGSFYKYNIIMLRLPASVVCDHWSETRHDNGPYTTHTHLRCTFACVCAVSRVTHGMRTQLKKITLVHHNFACANHRLSTKSHCMCHHYRVHATSPLNQ